MAYNKLKKQTKSKAWVLAVVFKSPNHYKTMSQKK